MQNNIIVKNIKITTNLDIKELKKLNKLDKEVKVLIKQTNNPFNPIWQDIKWNQMLLKAWWEDSWFLVYISEKIKSNSTNKVKIITSITLEKRKIFKNYYWLFSLWWPIWDLESKNLELLKKEINKILKKEKIVFAQIESFHDLWLIYPKPISYKNTLEFASTDSKGENEKEKNNIFKEWEYKRFVYQTWVKLDLELSEEDLLKNMKSKTRYNIRLSKRKWVESEQVKNTKENLQIFYDLLLETTSRNGFNWNNLDYYRILLEYIEENNLWWLFFSKKDNEVIAAWIFIFYQDTAFYYYWASTNDNLKRKFMSSYSLQWEAIRVAKELGLKYYDFWWISKDITNKDDSLAWVTRVKLWFNQEYYSLPNSYFISNRYYILYIIKILQFIKKALKFSRK